MASILVVDDEKNILTALRTCLTQEGYEVLVASDGASALRTVSERAVDLAILDIVMPGMSGMDVLERLSADHPGIKVIMISAMGTIEYAVKATKLGAYDFIEKPLSLDKLLLVVRHALEMGELERENLDLKRRMVDRDEMIGESQAMQRIRWEIEQAATSNARVLIRGENGTGKELVARALYRASPRKDQPFVEVNCAAIPGDLIESELFGHIKGSFTGADMDRKGKFEEAHGGTLFLDEVGDMSLKTQAKVLRCLQENRIQKVGGTGFIQVDVRVVAATNQDLEEKMRAGEFREDLFFRLNVIPIHVPPLRDRKEDIPILARHFIERFCQENRRKPKSFTEGAVSALTSYRWPGNVRELKNACERLAIMLPSEAIGDRDVVCMLRPAGEASGGEMATRGELKHALARFEKEFIEKVLEAHEGNVTNAARELGVERSLLYKKMRRLEGVLDEGGSHES